MSSPAPAAAALSAQDTSLPASVATSAGSDEFYYGLDRIIDGLQARLNA
jgi:hypothetical protein